MNDEVVIVTPELPPAVGGVADYTQRLNEAWPDKENLQVLVPRNAMEELLPGVGRVLVQYSAYGFDHHGYPRKLIRALIDWKTKTGGRLVVMFHEIWTFWPVTNKNFFVQLLHRRAIKSLLKSADKVFTSTESQAEHLRALSSPNPIHVLPVGSNIRRNEDVDLARIPGCAVIFGLQRARLRGLRKMRSSLSSLAAAGYITKIISIGAGGDSNLHNEERSLLNALQLREGFEQLGSRPEREISALLLAASFGIFAHDELSLTKSGTFMAYAAHELNVLADFADKSKPAPICWLVAPLELRQGSSNSEWKSRAESLRAWQKENSSWELIARTFADALELNAAKLSRAGTLHS
jgi:glycosyltransferase involved in cell wall biosynthesis